MWPTHACHLSRPRAVILSLSSTFGGPMKTVHSQLCKTSLLSFKDISVSSLGVSTTRVKIISQFLLPSLSKFSAVSPSPPTKTLQTKLLEGKQSRVSFKLQNTWWRPSGNLHKKTTGERQSSELVQRLHDDHHQVAHIISFFLAQNISDVSRVANHPGYPETKEFPGYGTLSVKIEKIPVKVGWISDFYFFLLSHKKDATTPSCITQKMNHLFTPFYPTMKNIIFS